MPFLRLTRDRRGFENTFLLHADRPGDRPRLLYWYRTAPGIVLGRPALDEDAIRTIEEQHPDIEFDWPAILALSEVMMHEDEAPARVSERPGRKQRARDQDRGAADDRRQDPREASIEEQRVAAEDVEPAIDQAAIESNADGADETEAVAPRPHSTFGLLEELVGREIATRLRARYAEISARIHERGDLSTQEAWLKRAEPLNPDLWLTPGAVLAGVQHADPLFEQLRQELLHK